VIPSCCARVGLPAHSAASSSTSRVVIVWSPMRTAGAALDGFARGAGEGVGEHYVPGQLLE
jgi:hypothetical protein